MHPVISSGVFPSTNRLFFIDTGKSSGQTINASIELIIRSFPSALLTLNTSQLNRAGTAQMPQRWTKSHQHRHTGSKFANGSFLRDYAELPPGVIRSLDTVSRKCTDSRSGSAKHLDPQAISSPFAYQFLHLSYL